MPIPANETLTFGAADAAKTYLYLIEMAKGDVPWWAIGDSRDWTPACIGDVMPLKGAERAVVTAAILASPTSCHLGRWWQESRLATAPSAAIEVTTPSLRWLRPCETGVYDMACDDVSTVDVASIIDRLLEGIAISDGTLGVPFPAGERGAPATSATAPPPRSGTELAAIVERLAMMHAQMDQGMLSSDTLAHVLACGLTAAFALSSLGVDPYLANADGVAQPTYYLAHIASFDADRRVTSLISAADAAERMAERILEPVRPNVRDIMAKRPRIPVPLRVTTGPDTLGHYPCTLTQVVAQAQRVARLLDHDSTRAS